MDKEQEDLIATGIWLLIKSNDKLKTSEKKVWMDDYDKLFSEEHYSSSTLCECDCGCTPTAPMWAHETWCKSIHDYSNKEKINSQQPGGYTNIQGEGGCTESLDSNRKINSGFEESGKASKKPSADTKCKCGHSSVDHDRFENQCQGEDWDNGVGKYLNCHCRSWDFISCFNS